MTDPVPDGEPAPSEPKKAKRKLYTHEVVQSLLEGQREESIAKWLEKKGLTREQVEQSLSKARARISAQVDEQAAEMEAALEEELRERKRRDLVYGALWFGGGLLLTVVTYSAAAEGGGGGRYVLAWGPMIYGGFRLLKAL